MGTDAIVAVLQLDGQIAGDEVRRSRRDAGDSLESRAERHERQAAAGTRGAGRASPWEHEAAKGQPRQELRLDQQNQATGEHHAAQSCRRTGRPAPTPARARPPGRPREPHRTIARGLREPQLESRAERHQESGEQGQARTRGHATMATHGRPKQSRCDRHGEDGVRQPGSRQGHRTGRSHAPDRTSNAPRSAAPTIRRERRRRPPASPGTPARRPAGQHGGDFRRRAMPGRRRQAANATTPGPTAPPGRASRCTARPPPGQRHGSPIHPGALPAQAYGDATATRAASDAIAKRGSRINSRSNTGERPTKAVAAAAISQPNPTTTATTGRSNRNDVPSSRETICGCN